MTTVVSVIEVGTNEVKCKPIDTLVKRTLSFNRKEIFTITYKGGHIDTLNKQIVEDSLNLIPGSPRRYTILMDDNHLYYRNKLISHAACKKLLVNRAAETRDPDLNSFLSVYNSKRSKQKKAATFGITLLGISLVSTLVSGILAANNNSFEVFPLGLGRVCFIGSLTSFIAGGVFNKQKKRNFKSAIEAYNNTYK